MRRYLLLNMNETMAPPKDAKEAQERMGPWMAWVEENKAIIEICQPLKRDGKAVAGSGAKDYKAAKVDVDGAIVIKAASMEDAVRIAQSTPHAKKGRTSIVREFMEM